MSTMSHRRAVAAISAGALLALPAVSLADPPADSTSSKGAPPAAAYRDYSMNSAGGAYAPARNVPPRVDGLGITPIHTQVGPAHTASSAQSPSGDGFAWGDAAAGAGVVLILTVGLGLGGRTVVRRRHAPARLSL